MGLVKNSGFIFLGIVFCAVCCASQMFSGYFGQLIGFAPAAVQPTMRTVSDGASAVLSCIGSVFILLAFVAAPGG